MFVKKFKAWGVEPQSRNSCFFIMVGIYKITSPSGKIYIGQSEKVETRFKRHLNYFNCCESKTNKLHISFRFFGVKNHDFCVIEECDKSNLNDRERYWQDFYDVLSFKGLNDSLTESKEKRKVLSNSLILRYSIAKDGFVSPNKGKSRNIIFNEKQRDTMLNKDLASNKIVLNIETGVYYKNVREASYAHGYKQKTLSAYLRGERKNKTQMIYAS